MIIFRSSENTFDGIFFYENRLEIIFQNLELIEEDNERRSYGI